MLRNAGSKQTPSGRRRGQRVPQQPRVIDFLRSYYKKHRKMPGCTRKSWKTVNAIIADCLQARLFQF